MKPVWWACIFLALVAGLAGARGARGAELGGLHASKAEVRKAVVATIEGQLGAFREGDVAKAYRFAAVVLQARTTPREFARLVQRGYPEIWTNERAECGIVRDDGERAVVRVQVFAKGGGDATYDYVLLKDAGGWGIAGVVRHAGRGADGA